MTRHLAILCLSSFPGFFAEQGEAQYVVENRAARYEVTSKLGADTGLKYLAYEEVYRRVAAGERLTWTGQPPGLPAGTYDCYPVGGVPHMRLLTPAPQAIAPAPYSPFTQPYCPPGEA
jgi:hypothetical protein